MLPAAAGLAAQRGGVMAGGKPELMVGCWRSAGRRRRGDRLRAGRAGRPGGGLTAA